MSAYEEILAQHASIVTHLDRLTALVQETRSRLTPAQRRQMLRQHLTALREVLVPHFEAEEEGGYLHDVVDARPDLARRVATTGEQHQAILEHVDLTLASAADKGLASLAADAQVAIDRMREHEATERELIQEAALREMSASD